MVESALWEASLFEQVGFHDFKISVKHHDPVVMIKAYELLSQECDYPLHLGVTEAGPAFQGTIKSAVAFGHLLAEGIGDTIRVSLSDDPVEEVKVGVKILESLNLRPRGLEIVSCPMCGHGMRRQWHRGGSRGRSGGGSWKWQGQDLPARRGHHHRVRGPDR